jgi:hypothetical protein
MQATRRQARTPLLGLPEHVRLPCSLEVRAQTLKTVPERLCVLLEDVRDAVADTADQQAAVASAVAAAVGVLHAPSAANAAGFVALDGPAAAA